MDGERGQALPDLCPRLDRLPTYALDDGLRLAVARTPRARLLGLAWLDGLPADQGLLFPRCGSVHTFGMRFPIDVIFLARDHRVIRVAKGVPRRRFVAARGTKSVVEVGAGRAEAFIGGGLEVALVARSRP